VSIVLTSSGQINKNVNGGLAVTGDISGHLTIHVL